VLGIAELVKSYCRKRVERFINVMKQSRRVATRYEKTARNFLGFVLFVSTLVMLN